MKANSGGRTMSEKDSIGEGVESGKTGTVSAQLDALSEREEAFERAERELDSARACVTDLLSLRCLAVAEKLGIDSGKDFRDVVAERDRELWRVSWNEYWQYEIYDRIRISIPADVIDLSDREFLSQLESIALRCTATSDVTEEQARRQREQEAKDRREYERLSAKFAITAPKQD